MKTEFSKLPPSIKKAFRARQRLMLCADILDIAVTEDLPRAKMAAGNTKMRINRVRQDIDLITKAFAGEILTGTEEGIMGSKDFAYAFYTIINILKDWPDDELYALAKELQERSKHGN